MLKWLIFAAAAAYAVVQLRPYLRPTPDAAIALFLSYGHEQRVAADQIECPLIRAGPLVCPPLLELAGDTAQPMRLHMLDALGALKCVEAPNMLRKIVLDSTETDGVRATALESLRLIDPVEAHSAVSAVGASTSAYVGRDLAEALHDAEPERMTYLEAVLCRRQ